MEGLLVFILLMIIISSSHGSDDTVAYGIFGERFAYECNNGLNVSYGDAESGGFFAEVRFIFPRPTLLLMKSDARVCGMLTQKIFFCLLRHVGSAGSNKSLF